MTTTTPAAVEAPLSLCVPADLIGVPHLFVSTEAARYYLCGVFLSPLAEGCGITATATDGHALGCVHSEHGHAAADIILRIDDKGFARMCRKFGRKRFRDVETAWVCAAPGAIAADGEKQAPAVELFLVKCGSDKPDAATIAGFTRHAPDPKAMVGLLARTTAEAIDGTFPEWRRVIPTTNEPKVIVNPGFVQAGLLEQATDAAKAYEAILRIVAPGSHEVPHFIDLGFRDFVGVLMPYRDTGGGTHYDRPEWLRVPSAADTAKAARSMDPEPEKIAA